MNVTTSIGEPPPGLLDEDDALATLARWTGLGRRCALVTIVGIEGGSPRFVGAQMVVSEDGRYHGYLSGGCLEQAIVVEAQSLMQSGENRLVRYGKGSPYFDVKLPCGSGIDIYFDVNIAPETIAGLVALRRDRRAFALISDLAAGTSRIDEAPALAASTRTGDVFTRIYLPPPRLVLVGSGPAMPALARLAAVAGMEAQVWASDEPTRQSLDDAGVRHEPSPSPPETFFEAADSYTAVVLAFHEHDMEPAILAKVLRTSCFYIGVLGNHAVHRRRLEMLRIMGFGDADLARLRAPIGSIPQAKGKATLGFGVLAEIMAEAKARGIVG